MIFDWFQRETVRLQQLDKSVLSEARVNPAKLLESLLLGSALPVLEGFQAFSHRAQQTMPGTASVRYGPTNDPETGVGCSGGC